MQLTVRKNFVFDKTIANYLEEIAQETKQSMTALVQELIEERYKQIKVKKRLALLEKMRGSANGLLTDFSIQSTKENREI
ncbi:MAG: hypothetical protein KU29_03345 [Sulfurovum sp. FS06-10]|jgi:predicted DNA-binding ribbon-helix-helix protein|nr:MAG: hypothetical protein KU29_03345 [Sulfurovum sp. FS06-10]